MLAHPLADEVRNDGVHLGQVCVPEGQRDVLAFPRSRERLLASRRVELEESLMAHIDGHMTTVGLAKGTAHRLRILAEAADDVRIHGARADWRDVVGCSLEDGELRRNLRDFRYRLHAGRSGANDTDSLAT